VLPCVLQFVAVVANQHLERACNTTAMFLSFSVLMRISVYCSVLQRVTLCVAVRCSGNKSASGDSLRCHCGVSLVQCVAVHCSVLQCAAVCAAVCVAVCVAVSCSVLQWEKTSVAVSCSALQWEQTILRRHAMPLPCVSRVVRCSVYCSVLPHCMQSQDARLLPLQHTATHYILR